MEGLFCFIKWAVITIGGLIVVGNLGVALFAWSEGKDRNGVLMKFKQWRELYDLNPGEWNVKGTFPFRRIFTAPTGGFEGVTWGRPYKDIMVRFSFFDTFRFALWQSRVEKRKKQAFSNEQLRLLLRAAQSDIDKLRAQSEQELEEAKARTEQVRSQLGKEK